MRGEPPQRTLLINANRLPDSRGAQADQADQWGVGGEQMLAFILPGILACIRTRAILAGLP
jgi:hypothetical protein